MTSLRRTRSGTLSSRSDGSALEVILDRHRWRTASHQTGELDGAPAGAGRTFSACGGTRSPGQIRI